MYSDLETNALGTAYSGIEEIVCGESEAETVKLSSASAAGIPLGTWSAHGLADDPSKIYMYIVAVENWSIPQEIEGSEGIHGPLLLLSEILA